MDKQITDNSTWIAFFTDGTDFITQRETVHDRYVVNNPRELGQSTLNLGHNYETAKKKGKGKKQKRYPQDHQYVKCKLSVSTLRLARKYASFAVH